MKPLAACALALPLLSGCVALPSDPASLDFRVAVGADDWPLPEAEPLAVPVLDAPESGATAEDIATACARLASEDAAVRDAAEAALAAAGRAAVPALRGVRAGKDLEASKRAGRLVDRILYGEVDGLRLRLQENLPEDARLHAVLEEALDPRVGQEAATVELLEALTEACVKGGMSDPSMLLHGGLSQIFRVLVGAPDGEDRARRRAAGYDDVSDPAAMAVFARIARESLRMKSPEARRSAFRAVAALPLAWQAALTGDLVAAAQGAEPEFAEKAMEILASAARAGADAVPCRGLGPDRGLPAAPANFAFLLRPHARTLLDIARSAEYAAPARAWALEAASYSGDAALASEVAALRDDPVLAPAVFFALAALGGPEAEAEIVRAVAGERPRVPLADAEAAAARRGVRGVLPFLVLRDRSRAAAVAAAVATREDAEVLLRMLVRGADAAEIRPLLGAVVRLAPFPAPHDRGALDAARALLRADNPDLRFLAACTLAAIDAREGIAAWGPLLGDDGAVTLTWPGWRGEWMISDYAPGALSRLTGLDEGDEDPADFWDEWWDEHRAEYAAD
ncbi:MAG: hypothetical protein IT452_22880 [Planctomycetia bacterium]|nr:hypothetical protein [Planctomycetia bacterium]